MSAHITKVVVRLASAIDLVESKIIIGDTTRIIWKTHDITKLFPLRIKVLRLMFELIVLLFIPQAHSIRRRYHHKKCVILILKILYMHAELLFDLFFSRIIEFPIFMFDFLIVFYKLCFFQDRPLKKEEIMDWTPLGNGIAFQNVKSPQFL